MLKTFPNCQFLLTTHSPQVLGEIKPEHLFLLNRDENTGEIRAIRPNQSFGLDSNLVLEALMGTTARSGEIQEDLDDISKLIEAEDYGKAKQKIESVRRKTNGTIPELAGADAEIFMEESLAAQGSDV